MGAYLERERPISLRKVVWSGTKGIGAGTGGRRICAWRHRVQMNGTGDRGGESSFRVIIFEIYQEKRGGWWWQLRHRLGALGRALHDRRMNGWGKMVLGASQLREVSFSNMTEWMLRDEEANSRWRWKIQAIGTANLNSEVLPPCLFGKSVLTQSTSHCNIFNTP